VLGANAAVYMDSQEGRCMVRDIWTSSQQLQMERVTIPLLKQQVEIKG